jgi:hypothetical protein
VLNKKDGLLHPQGLPADHTAGGRVGGGGQDRRAGLLRQMHQQDRPARVAIPRYSTCVSGGNKHASSVLTHGSNPTSG